MRLEKLRAIAVVWLTLVASVSLPNTLATSADMPVDASQGTRLLRMPDICGDVVAFVQAGDLHVVAATGGVARRLTDHPGQELFPKFSPDCRRIAFSAEYDGTRQVYVVGIDGGTPQQRTWYNDVGPLPPRAGSDYRVLDWTPGGRYVLVLANRTPHGKRLGRPYLVPADRGMEAPLPIAESGGGSLSPDGRYYVFTPIDRDFRSWKRYRGGRAPDVWRYDRVQQSSVQLTADRASDAHPMWIGDRVIFASDRNGTVNLFSMAGDGGRARQVTRFRDMDVLWPSAGRDAIVFEQDGWLWRLDPRTEAVRRIPVVVPEPLRHAQTVEKALAGHIESIALVPERDALVVAARGELAMLDLAIGRSTPLMQSSGTRERGIALSHDGRRLAYYSDADGAYALYVRDTTNGQTRRFPLPGSAWPHAPQWSPDDRHLAYADQSRRLYVFDTDNGHATEVDRGTYGPLLEHAWSPDGRWLAYTRRLASQLDQVWLYSLADATKTPATDPAYSTYSPSFDPDGRWLYVLSKRDVAVVMSAYEENYVATLPARAYAIHLRDDAPAWEGASKIASHPVDAATNRATIDIAGIARRMHALPVVAGDYRDLRATSDGVLYLAGTDDDAEQGRLALRILPLGADAAAAIVDGIKRYWVRADGRRIVVQRGGELASLAPAPAQDFAASTIDLASLRANVDPRAEWRQMYDDAWRILRDWFYDPAMHGGSARWEALRTRYRPWVDAAAHRTDLDHVLHQLVGELEASHLYVNAGDQPVVARRDGGLLGAEFDGDPSGYYRIARILGADAPAGRPTSPLLAAGARVGEYVVAIDGVDVRTVDNLYRLLQDKAGQRVRVAINASPQAEGARERDVKAIASEHGLRYQDWLAQRRAIVERLSAGRIGYLHLPDTGDNGYAALVLGLAAQRDKAALIVDIRYNAGGRIPDRLVELLARRPLVRWSRRDQSLETTPALLHAGPKALLLNGYTSSGGDTFANLFRQLSLGRLIGTRSWGGTIAMDGNPPLVDGGEVLAATQRAMSPAGQWTVENVGVVPDIEVVEAPEHADAGRDLPLERAVAELAAQLAQ